MTTPEPNRPGLAGLLRVALRLAVIMAFVAGLFAILDWAHAQADMPEGMMTGVLVALLLAYMLLMAVPFVPGIEIGVSLLVLKGGEIAPFVYLATVGGLTLALLAGRCLPYPWVRDSLADLRLARAAGLVDRLGRMDREERLRHLSDRLPAAVRPFLGFGRYVLLALLFNLPGNALLGGGGGIAFAAGLSRLFHTGLSIAVIALAVLPVPLSVWLMAAGPVR